MGSLSEQCVDAWAVQGDGVSVCGMRYNGVVYPAIRLTSNV